MSGRWRTVKAHTRRCLSYTYLRKVKSKKYRKRIYVYKCIRIKSYRVAVAARPKSEIIKPKRRLPSVGKWYRAIDYQIAIEDEKAKTAQFVYDVEMGIFRHKPQDDMIHLPSLFVWDRPIFPSRIKVFGQSHPFDMIRIWFWVYHTIRKQWSIYCRTSLIPLSNLKELEEEANHLLNVVTTDLGLTHFYLEVREDSLIAWTGYLIGEKLSRRKKEGGTE